MTRYDHWLVWLSGIDGPGYYGRQNWGNITARQVFMRLRNGSMVSYLGEAARLPAHLVEEVVRVVQRFGSPTHPKAAGAARALVKWEMIEPRLFG